MKENNKQKQRNNKRIYLVLFVIFSLLCGALYAFCLKSIPIPVVANHRRVFFWLGEFLLLVLLLASVVFTLARMEKIAKLCITAYVLLLLSLIVVFILVLTGVFEVIKNTDTLRDYISRAGKWTWAVFIVMQFLQVVALPIPGTVSTAVGVLLFGPVQCMFLSLIGIVLGSLVAFIVGRKLGYKAVVWLVGEEDLQKWMSKLKGKDSVILSMMFLFPLFPDDMLCFIAGLSSMSFAYFTVMTLVCRAISVASTCFSLNFIPFTTWWGILIWIALFALVALCFVIVYKNIDKIQNAIKRFKERKR